MKKAQVTLWIIIGIFILLSLSLVAYYVTQRYLEPIQERVVVPADVQPLYDFTQSCVQTVSKQGLARMGLQGGYVNVPFSIVHNPRSYVAVDPNGVIRIPYWFYNGEDRTPPLEFMERELALYIEDNIDACFRDFEDFKDFNVNERSELKPSVDIGDDNILVTLDWSLDAEFPDKTINVPQIQKKLPVKLKQMWVLADKMMRAENERSIFENITIDLMAMHPDIPMDGMELDCSPKRWPIVQVKNNIEEVLQYNIPQARVKGTDYPEFSADDRVYRNLAKEREDIFEALEAGAENPTLPENTPQDAYYYFRMFFDVGAEADDLRAGFQFLPEWGLELDVQPRDGGMLRSNLVQGAQKYLSFACINQHHFVYDVVYPVVMTVRDPLAFGGEGYLFQFAFPVIVDNNQPKRHLRGFRVFETRFGDDDYCNRLGGTEVDLRAEGFEVGLPFSVELDEANMSFACGTEQCFLGMTKADDEHYRLQTAMPLGCANPYITASKSGYLPDRKLLISSTDTELTMFLMRLKEMNIEIVKHKYFKVDNRLETSGELVQSPETALVYVAIQNSTLPYEQYIEYPSDETIIELAEDSRQYDITVFVTDTFGNLLAGYNAENLALTYNEIAQGDTIVFHVLQPAAIPSTEQARAEAVGLIFTDQFNDQLKPTIK